MDTKLFWGEMAPCDHAVEIYDRDEQFLASLERFVADGLTRGEAVVIVATPNHIASLEERLRQRGVELVGPRLEDRYIALSAARTLDGFMRNDWPDDESFAEVVGGILERARSGGRKVRVFGEMVALLWDSGQTAATVRLEFLWNKLLRTEKFPLFCAYPRAGFTRGGSDSLRDICALHSKVTGLEQQSAA